MSSAGGTPSFVSVSIEKHDFTLIAEAPMALCGWCFLKIVRQDKVVALRYVNSAGRTTSFVPVSVEEHGFTLIAEPPMALCGWCFLKIVRQDKIVALRYVGYKIAALRYVGSASRTAPLTRVS